MLGRSLCVIAILMIYGDIESNAKVLIVKLPKHIILLNNHSPDTSNQVTTNEIKKLNAEITKLNNDKTKLNNDKTKLNNEIIKLNNDKTKLNNEITKLNTKNDTLSKERDSLQIKISMLSASIANDSISKSNNNNQNSNAPEPKVDDSLNEADNVKLVLYIFLAALILLSLYMFSNRIKLQHQIEKQIKEYEIVNRDLKKKEDDLRREKGINEQIDKELIKQKEKTNQLEVDLKDANTMIRNTGFKSQANRDIIPTKEIKEIPKVVEKFFMSNPSSDGSFRTDSKHTNYDPTSCYYEFEKTGDNLYEFFLIDEAAPKALKYPDIVIDPVCDSIEGSSRSSQKIITFTKGKAELDGSVFRVIEKSQIKYV
jgi:predicted  nucleic acid-binding Zn-ribbon protein